MVLAILGLVALVVSSVAAQGPRPPDNIKDQIKSAISTEGLSASGASSSGGSPSHPTGRPPRVGFNRQVSRDQDPATVFRSGASELTIAVASNGNRIVAGWNDGEGFGFKPFQPVDPPLGLSGYGFSSDGGQTFTDGGTPPFGTRIGLGPGTQGQSATGRYITRGDPWLAVGGTGNGTFYYANLAIWDDQPALPPAGVSVHTGSFRDKNFSWTDSVLIQSPNYPDDFVDKEALAVDRRGNRTALYVSLTNFIEVCDIPFFGFGQIELYRSLDGGATWSRTIIQPDESFITDPTDPNCGLEGIIDQGSMPAVGPNGELYVAWERGWFEPLVGAGAGLPRAEIAVVRSDDQGATFGPRVSVASICSGALSPPAAYNRTSNNDFPRIAVAQSGPHRGRVYVTFQDCSAASGAAPFGSDTDVYVSFSDDGGATWSTPTPVHPVADGKKQFWPTVSVDTTGNVDVTYYEMRDINVTPDPNDIECSVRIAGPLTNPVLRKSKVTTFSDVFWAQSTDGGATWQTPVRVTDVSTNWCAATPLNSIIPNFGDYNTSLSFGNNVFAVWADGRNEGILDRLPTAFYARIDAIGRAPR
jgi:hypothetical protein